MKKTQKGSVLVRILTLCVVLSIGIYVYTHYKNQNTSSDIVNNDSETIGDFVGYYVTYDIPDNEMFEGGTCHALKVISGHEGLLTWFRESQGNKDIEIPLNITNLSVTEKTTLKASTQENPITITLQKEKVIGRDAPACFPSVKILKIISITIKNSPSHKVYGGVFFDVNHSRSGGRA